MICVWLKETLDRLIDYRSVRVCKEHPRNTTCTIEADSFICSGLMLPLTIQGAGGGGHLKRMIWGGGGHL